MTCYHGTQLNSGGICSHCSDSESRRPSSEKPEAIRLIASLKAGTVAPPFILKKPTAHRRQSQLYLALQELGRI
jgi:TnpA family transposase